MSAVEPPATTSSGAVVLIIDDEPLNRDLLRRVLFRDYAIREAADAEMALRLLETEPVDAILCDQIMPGRSGTELLREVQKRYPKIVAILLTGFEDAPEVEEAYQDGVLYAVVGKPWTAPQLKELIAAALAGRVG